MRNQNFISILCFILFTGCTRPILECYLSFMDYKRTYNFDFSKTELKDKIIDAYTYDNTFFIQNLGLTLIEEEKINAQYRRSVDIWLQKNNWDEFNSEIRSNTRDTLNLIIAKHHSRKELKFSAIISGDDNNSALTINGFKYQKLRACTKEKDFYLLKLSNKIKKKLIDKLKA